MNETELAGLAQETVLASGADLGNTDSSGIAFENQRKVIEVSEPKKPNSVCFNQIDAFYLFFAFSHLYSSRAIVRSNVWNHLRKFKRQSKPEELTPSRSPKTACV